MVIHFGRWGNSLALRLPAALARQLGASEGSAARLVVEDGRLVVQPLVAEPRYDLDELVAAMTDENMHDEIPTGPPVGQEVW